MKALEIDNIVDQMHQLYDDLKTIDRTTEVFVIGLFAYQKLHNEISEVAKVDPNSIPHLSNLEGIELFPSIELGGWDILKMTKEKYLKLKREGKL